MAGGRERPGVPVRARAESCTAAGTARNLNSGVNNNHGSSDSGKISYSHGFITILLAGIRFNAIEIEPSGY
jgi:hypothetical protein